MLKGEMELAKKDIVVKEYRKLCKQANKKVPSYMELRSISKEALIEKCVVLRNKLIIWG